MDTDQVEARATRIDDEVVVVVVVMSMTEGASIRVLPFPPPMNISRGAHKHV